MVDAANPTVQTILYQTDLLYIHCSRPNKALNRFQEFIQYVQNKMGFSCWHTTHVFVSYNGHIIDRTGLYTVTTKEEGMRYLQNNYRGYSIESYGVSDPNIAKTFTDLYDTISKTRGFRMIHDEYMGDEIFVENLVYQPNNTMYGIGRATIANIQDVLKLHITGAIVKESEAIQQGLVAMKDTRFEAWSTQKNPAFCSVIMQNLVPALRDLTLTRYPALTHSFLETLFEEKWMSKVTTKID